MLNKLEYAYDCSDSESQLPLFSERFYRVLFKWDSWQSFQRLLTVDILGQTTILFVHLF